MEENVEEDDANNDLEAFYFLPLYHIICIHLKSLVMRNIFVILHL